MTCTDASYILSTSKTCNRLDQFLRLVKGDICTHNPLIFSSHRVRSSYSGRSTRSAGHVGCSFRVEPNFIISAPQNLLASQEKALPRPVYCLCTRASNPFDHAWTKDECFCLQIRLGNRSAVSCPRIGCSGSRVRC